MAGRKDEKRCFYPRDTKQSFPIFKPNSVLKLTGLGARRRYSNERRM
jgi:hypothetical protein